MKKISYPQYGIDVFEAVCPNKMRLVVLPIEGFTETYAGVYVSVGGFKHIEDISKSKVPLGFAHFLEHVLFNTKDGDGLSLLAKCGANGNAYTGPSSTVFYFSTNGKYDEPLKIVFNMVSNFFLTDKVVEEEKSIILEEFKMTYDDPYQYAYEKLLNNLYFESPIKNPILGYEGDINAIHMPLLKKLYKEYYDVSNMITIVAGNVKPDEVEKLVSSYNFKNSFEKAKTNSFVYHENYLSAKKSFDEGKFEIADTILSYGIKLPQRIELFDKFSYYTIAMYEIIPTLLFGPSSKITESLQNKGLIIGSGNAFIEEGGEDACLVFQVKTHKPEQLKEQLDAYFNNINKYFTAKDLKLIKKEMIGSTIRETTNAEDMFNNMADALTNNVSYLALLDRVKEIKVANLTKFGKILKNCPKSVYILKPNN